jgi:hypothetical protein
LLAASKAPEKVRFREHVIESKISGGYAVLIADLNHDGRPDVIGLTQQSTELAWYENPIWERHVLIGGMVGLVNVAAEDIDGDGIPELAVESGFSMVAAKSEGLVWVLHHRGDSRGLWRATKIDALTTSHHIGWADIDGDGKKELINAPLIGSRALAPRYEGRVSLVYYRTDDWKRRLIDDQLSGVLHRLRIVHWDGGKREQILTAGFDGIVLHGAEGSGDNIRWKNELLSHGHQEPPPRAGTSDVRLGQLNQRRFLAAVEPWHGNEVVVYTEDDTHHWQRRIIFSELSEGHEVVVGDFNGDGLDDIAAADRGKGANVHIFYAQDDRGADWRHEIIDRGGMAGSGCAAADINGDARLDLVCIGASTANIKWYENLGN